MLDWTKTVRKSPSLNRGKVWCTVCNNVQDVDSARALSYGWPQCCGYTMTIDSPEERQRYTERNAN